MSKLSKWLRKGEKWVSDHVPHEHSRDRRAANQATADQISLYQQQRDTLRAENTRLEGERANENKRLARRQIRSLRSSFRSPGFMGSSAGDYAEKLGE